MDSTQENPCDTLIPADAVRYQTHCPACNAIMLFEIGREHEGKRARFTCPRCSKTLEASTGLD
jgi:transposase-like protein